MSTSIQLDPYSKNNVLNLGINSNKNDILHGSDYGMQSMMQLQIMNIIMNGLKFIKTNDPMIDGIINVIIQSMIIGISTLFMNQFINITEWIKKKINTFCKEIIFGFFFFKNFILRHIFNKNIPKLILRNVDIPYISDNRQVNELYKAVFWYLTNDNQINYLHEPYLQYVFDKKITIENKDYLKKNLNIHKILTQQKTKTITYKKHEIKYYLSTELITVYTDKDRKRENYKIFLSTVVNDCAKTDILDEFCQHCLTEYINNLTSGTWSQLIYTNKEGEWKSVLSNNTRKMETIILKKGLKEDIKNDIQLFLNSEEWYKDRDIPYTRGYLFYGHPGTGKTSMIKALSNYSKRHIHYLMLNEIKSDAELFDLLKKINYKETILVIEDIDAMASFVKSRDFEKKTHKETIKEGNKESDIEIDTETDTETDTENNISEQSLYKNKKFRIKEKNKKKSCVTLSGLLNAIDGVFSCNGRILIMTTNHPEVLDSALIRPGRIDSKFLFDNCDKEQVKGLYEMFFNLPIEQNQINAIDNLTYSPAHITSVFLRYRNNPKEALYNLNANETKIVVDKKKIK
jgi:AAA+ superfamily predicted ATPase